MGRKTGKQRRSKQRSIRNKRKSLSRDRSSKAARTARRNSRLNAKRGTSRTGKLKINVNARRAAKHLSNSRVAKALGLSGIGNRITRRIPRSWKVRANLKTAIKSKIGEKNYRRTSANNPGSGRRLTDQQIADYDFYSKYNPQGITVSQAKKMYANQLREGISLKQAMASNPAETGYYDALIPDRKPTRQNTRHFKAPGLRRPNHPGGKPANRNNIRASLPYTLLTRSDPRRDWLSSLYKSHNINKGNLDKKSRDYWTREAANRGRAEVMRSIIGTSKAQGTYGGRKKPRRINTGSGRSTPNQKLQSYLNARFAGSGHGYPSKAERERRRGGGRHSMIANSIAATMAARGGF